jgi:hypothetical protein
MKNNPMQSRIRARQKRDGNGKEFAPWTLQGDFVSKTLL